ncbi:MAG: hypothetical protein K1X57_19780 [Gemmataceae bacterium]|nr:hypothetical protein [Gemmataceae bacterium]
MDLEALNVKLSYPLIITGVAAALIGFFWFVGRLFNRSKPFPRGLVAPAVLILVGLAVASAPPVIGKLVPIDLGPRDKMVEGERHLTLTGWDRKDYAFLASKPDTVVLQMANTDVTDATVALLAEYSKLRELDVSDSKITDAGLETIKKLPALTTLYLNRTAVSDAGVRTLADHATLKVIHLRGTAVTKEAADQFKAGKPGRRALIDEPK